MILHVHVMTVNVMFGFAFQQVQFIFMQKLTAESYNKDMFLAFRVHISFPQTFWTRYLMHLNAEVTNFKRFYLTILTRNYGQSEKLINFYSVSRLTNR